MKNKFEKIKKLTLFVLILLLSMPWLMVNFVQADTTTTTTTCPPGTYHFETGIPFFANQGECKPISQGISGLIVSLLPKLFIIAGILAFAMIVWAGFEYAVSGGDTNKQKDAQDRIMNAIIGLVLLFAFYLIIYVINPDILKTQEPQLTTVNLPSTPFNPTPGPNNVVDSLPGFSKFCPKKGTPPLVPYSSYDVLDEPSECFYLKDSIYTQLQNLYASFPSWELTEACQRLITGSTPCWTTYKHDSLCHTTGDCVDIVLDGSSIEQNKAAFINAANGKGLDVYNEYKDECRTDKTTGKGHFHVVIHGFQPCTNGDCWSCAK